jgi:hypothetical protein
MFPARSLVQRHFEKPKAIPFLERNERPPATPTISEVLSVAQYDDSFARFRRVAVPCAVRELA